MIRVGAQVVGYDLHSYAFRVLKAFDEVTQSIGIAGNEVSLASADRLANKVVQLLINNGIVFWQPSNSSSWPQIQDYISLEREVLGYVIKELASLEEW